MRLSDWHADPPHRDATAPKVVAVIEPILAAMGTERDPMCWFVWGDDPQARYSLLVPTAPGLVVVNVRVNVPQEGPRAAGKLIRWNRVQVGELAIETVSGGHRLMSFQVEGNVLRGSDAEADAIAAFALQVFNAIDGRPIDATAGGSLAKPARQGAGTAKRAPTARTTRTAATKPAAKPAARRSPATKGPGR
jgi:hypothetical protein